MWKALTIGTILLVVAGLFAARSLVLTSPDYAAGGTCSATDIRQTYIALSSLHDGFGYATAGRVHDEWWQQKPHRQDLRSHLQLNLNGMLDLSFGKQQTAAYICNRSHPYLRGVKYPHTVPDNVALLGGLVTDAPERWKLATCASMHESYGSHAVTPETVTDLRRLCR